MGLKSASIRRVANAFHWSGSNGQHLGMKRTLTGIHPSLRCTHDARTPLWTHCFHNNTSFCKMLNSLVLFLLLPNLFLSPLLPHWRSCYIINYQYAFLFPSTQKKKKNIVFIHHSISVFYRIEIALRSRHGPQIVHHGIATNTLSDYSNLHHLSLIYRPYLH